MDVIERGGTGDERQRTGRRDTKEKKKEKERNTYDKGKEENRKDC